MIKILGSILMLMSLSACSVLELKPNTVSRDPLLPIGEVPSLVVYHADIPRAPSLSPFLFRDIRGRNFTDSYPPLKTYLNENKIFWDDDYLYLSAVLEEPDLVASLTQRDTVIFYDNDFEIFLDPDRDNHAYGEIEINAKNTVWDLLLTKPYKDQGLALTSWDVLNLSTHVSLHGTLNNGKDTDCFWEVTARIPFASLGALGVNKAPADGDVWHVNFSRVEWHYTKLPDGSYQKIPNTPEENWVWSPTGIVAIHHPERWGKLIFRKDAKSTYVRPTYDVEFALLNEIYYAQTAFYKHFQKYAQSLEELKNFGTFVLSENRQPAFEITDQGWRVTIDLSAGSPESKMSIIQDARVEYLK